MHGHGQCGYASTLSMAYTCFPAPAILVPFCKWDHVLGLSEIMPTQGHKAPVQGIAHRWAPQISRYPLAKFNE